MTPRTPSPGRGPSRRSLLLAAPAAAALGLLAACAQGPAPLPPRRMLGVGFEDAVAGPARLRELAGRLEAAGVNEVGIAAGRVDWTLFPWAGREEAWSADAREAGGERDLLAEAIRALRPTPDGAGRGLVLVVDVLAPRLIAERTELAAASSTGERLPETAGLAALARGAVAEEIVALVGELAARYRPEAVSLTELFLEDSTYSAADLRDYRQATGAEDWPRTAGGAIDTRDERVVDWRCRAVAELVARARQAAAEHGAELWMEVRAPRDRAEGDRRDSGHDYALLAEAADRLVLWDYFGVAEPGSPDTRSLARALARRDDGRGVLSIGLWDRPEGAIEPAELREAVEEAARGGSGAVWVTPASLMGEAHWRALAQAWRPDAP